MKDFYTRKEFTIMLLIIPFVIPLIYIWIRFHVYHEPIHQIILGKKDPIVLTFLLLVSTLPYATREYYREKLIRSIENDIPIFLSGVEAGLIAGMSVYSAYNEASKQTKVLGNLMQRILRGVRIGSTFEGEVDHHIPHDTYLLRIFKEYLKLLVIGGEELYRTMSDIREIFEKIVTFKKTLRSNAMQTASVFLTILGVYIAVLVMVIKMFLEGFTNTTIVSISQNTVNTIEATGAYMIYIQAIGSGIVISVLSGSNRNYMLLPMISASILGLISYAYFIL
ncbi:MAG: type II secretion system F family protein [Desulfurococcales archaeon]|nr:type II secretion system F family protein [Desulfurococcales archaeon]